MPFVVCFIPFSDCFRWNCQHPANKPCSMIKQSEEKRFPFHWCPTSGPTFSSQIGDANISSSSHHISLLQSTIKRREDSVFLHSVLLQQPIKTSNMKLVSCCTLPFYFFFFSYTYLPVYSNPFLCLQIIVAAFLAVAMAAPAELDAPVVAIVKSTNEMNEDGSYSFS